MTARTHPLENFNVRARSIFLWLAVGLPLLWGVMKTLQNALRLFR
jgi:hypothetical protein